MRRLLLLALLLSCTAGRGAEVRVFAAASLTDALQEIAAAYERQTGDDVVFHFAASNLMARQIERGAPADLFLSADERTMNALAAQRLIRNATRVSFLSNTLVVVVPREGGKAISSPGDLIGLSLALAEPSTVPAGVYAKSWLEKAGVWSRVSGSVVPTDNVRGALAAVASGNVDAAIVYKSDAKISDRVRVAFEVPRAEGPGISYPFAILRDAEQPRAAERFLAYLQSKAAMDIFLRHGFLPR
ncbi:MAG TPA: molybdate ABC transporter substrate-binding protein [Thermoanaerobaculia bacterium]|nr:molybdate ABC transporter substrate-binding protein [Thermoanaerobaculia bacterium]